LIQDALKMARGNRAKAARLLQATPPNRQLQDSQVPDRLAALPVVADDPLCRRRARLSRRFGWSRVACADRHIGDTDTPLESCINSAGVVQPTHENDNSR
jgi:hypothetical protein